MLFFYCEGIAGWRDERGAVIFPGSCVVPGRDGDYVGAGRGAGPGDGSVRGSGSDAGALNISAAAFERLTGELPRDRGLSLGSRAAKRICLPLVCLLQRKTSAASFRLSGRAVSPRIAGRDMQRGNATVSMDE
jgi:hypothetical protein